MPLQMDVRLELVDMAVITSGSTSGAVRWNPNAPYQPRVSGPTGTVPGFAHWANFYGFYRCVKYSYKVTFTNLEAFPCVVYCLNMNNDPGTSPTAFNASNPLCTNKVISSKGGMDRAEMQGTYTVAHVLGSDEVEYSDSYRSLINTTPADVTWLALGAQSNTASVLSNGVAVRLELRMFTRFYDRLQQ